MISFFESNVELVFWVFAVGVLGGCINHIIALINPSWDPGQSPAEHWFWVFANSIGIYFILNRTPYFVPVLVVWVLQQLYFHGGLALSYWREDGKISFKDLSVVFFMPALLGAYGWAVFNLR